MVTEQNTETIVWLLFGSRQDPMTVSCASKIVDQLGLSSEGRQNDRA